MKAYFQKPIDEEFNDSYSRRGLQPSVGSVQQFRKVEVDRGGAARRVGTTAQVAGVTTQATGKAVEMTGKGTKAVGRGLNAGGTAMMRAGAAMSGTGVGAIVGVPTIALGAGVKVMGLGTQAAGAGVEAAGKTTNQVGKAARKAGNSVKKIDRLQMGRRATRGLDGTKNKVVAAAKRLPGPVGKVAEHGGDTVTKLWERRKVTRANATILSVGLSTIWPIQLPIAFLSLGFFGMAATLDALKTTIVANTEAVVGETVTNFLGTVYEYTLGAGISGVDWIFEKIFGFSLIALGDPNNWFIATHFLVVIIGWSTLLLAVMIYLSFLINPFTGKGWQWKMGGFLIAAFGYLIPGLNILPWFAVYTACVWKNPE